MVLPEPLLPDPDVLVGIAGGDESVEVVVGMNVLAAARLRR
jgi:hypothetical protein